MLYSLTYVSSATMSFSQEQLKALLDVCIANNRRDGITGILLYKDGNFMQVMEGPQDVLLRTLARMENDTRHSGIIVLLQGHQRDRQFPDWSLAYRDLGDGSGKPTGYSEFMNTPLTGDEFAKDPSRAQRLLMMFKQAT